MKYLIHITAIWLLTVSCSKEGGDNRNSEASVEYLTAYTSGLISKEGTIKVVFREDMVADSQINQDVSGNHMELSPRVDGTVRWITRNTLEFRPDKNLKSGEKYDVHLKLSKIIPTSSGKVADFTFSFNVYQQAVSMHLDPLKSMNTNKWQRLEGRIVTADVADGYQVEKILTATFLGSGTTLKIEWEHGVDRREHKFRIDSIPRSAKADSVLVKWVGNSIEVDKSDSATVIIPSLNDFKVMQIRPVQAEQQYILVGFTDLLNTRQNLNGLIRVSGSRRISFRIEGNQIKIFNQSRWGGDIQVVVDPSVRNLENVELGREYRKTVNFREIKPGVKIKGKGVVVPGRDSLVLHFEAVNLRAVDVRVMRIFQNNIPQFLQSNEMDGSSGLRYVGRSIIAKSLDINRTGESSSEWKSYAINLKPLVEEDRGAIYRITLSFRQSQSLYRCPDSSGMINEKEPALNNYDGPGAQSSYWDNWVQGYDWYQRENPCHITYYMQGKRKASRNYFVSNLGILAKIGEDGKAHVHVNNLVTGAPEAGTSLEIFNFQHQLLGEGRTNNEGYVKVNLEDRPFLLVASKGGESGYLKLNGGNALPVSHFDVEGESIEKGLKGYLYGERGVWRPGDSLYLTFILEDSQDRLPGNHPVQFELFNPRGQLVDKISRSSSTGGFYVFKTATQANAPTGNWTARVLAGGVRFEKSLKIETVMPNRLKIKLELDSPYMSPRYSSMRGTVQSNWLHGAPSRNLEVKSDVRLNSVPTIFQGYREYSFDDPVRDGLESEHEIIRGSLDSEGYKEFSFSIDPEKNAPGKMKATIETRVFEPGGAFSTDRYSIDYHPYSRYVGLRLPKGDAARKMLLTDTTHQVKVVTLDPEGKKVSSARVEMTMYKIKWKWWWDKEKESLSQYMKHRNQQPVLKETIRLKSGEGTWKFKIKYPSWGRYLVRACDVDRGHCTGKITYIDWPGWAGRAQKDGVGANTLTFTADKEKYNTGEEAKIKIPASAASRVLLSVENGSRVIKQMWLKPAGGYASTILTITPEMSPNVFLHATLIQPYGSRENDRPLRMYGIIPLAVENPETVLEPKVLLPGTFRPGQMSSIAVSEKLGREMDYTLAVVDEGLLDLTRFKTPDPHSHFFRKEALGVRTWDLYDEISGLENTVIERLLSIGGDESLIQKENEGNRFPPMVKFMGPFHLDRGGSKTHEFEFPQYVGSVRVMVVAGSGGAYGNFEKAVPVKNPLMVLGVLPRTVSVQESISFPISVFAMDDKIKKVRVKVESEDGIQVLDSSEKTLEFKEVGDQLVSFKLKAGALQGWSKVLVTVEGSGEKATQEIDLHVRLPSAEVTDVVGLELEGGQEKQVTLNFPGMSGTNRAALEVSRIPPLNLSSRLKYLVKYPHGCVEQTTSSVFPQLYLGELMKMNKKQLDAIEMNIIAGIQRLLNYQTSQGGFAYWPGSHRAGDWVSSYVGHFLIESERKGYSIPGGMISRWKQYQEKQANSWSPGVYRADDHQAYRLFTMALAGKPLLGAMNRLREYGSLSKTAAVRLGVAYHLAGQEAVAGQLLTPGIGTLDSYQEMSGTYGSSLRDSAMYLESLVMTGNKKLAGDLYRKISGSLGEVGKWHSTQATAYSLLAIAKYLGVDDVGSNGDDLVFDYSFGSDPIEQVSTGGFLVQQPDQSVLGDSVKFRFKNNTGQKLYARVIMSGVPEPGLETASSNGLDLEVQYRDKQGNIISPDRLEQGKDFKAIVKIRNASTNQHYEELALSHLVPSGWEIHNDRMSPGSKNREKDIVDWQDIRDDRIYTYFDLGPEQSAQFEVLLNSSYLGRFYLPQVKVEAMYDASVQARTKGRWIEVIQSGK